MVRSVQAEDETRPAVRIGRLPGGLQRKVPDELTGSIRQRYLAQSFFNALCQNGYYRLKIKLIWSSFMSFDSSFNALTWVFCVQLDPVKRSVAKCPTTHNEAEDGARSRKPIFVNLRPNASFDVLELNTQNVELFVRYRLVQVSSKSVNNCVKFICREMVTLQWKREKELQNFK